MKQVTPMKRMLFMKRITWMLTACVALGGIASAGVPAKSPTLGETYPLLSKSPMSNAKLVTLPKGVVLRAGNVEIRQSQLDTQVRSPPSKPWLPQSAAARTTQPAEVMPLSVVASVCPPLASSANSLLIRSRSSPSTGSVAVRGFQRRRVALPKSDPQRPIQTSTCHACGMTCCPQGATL